MDYYNFIFPCVVRSKNSETVVIPDKESKGLKLKTKVKLLGIDSNKLSLPTQVGLVHVM